MRFFYATDIHGSEICFKKFLRAATFYKAEMLLLGGDYTSKQLTFIVALGHRWEVEIRGKLNILETRSELADFRSALLNQGVLTSVVSQDEFQELNRSETLKASLYEKEMRIALSRWRELAEASRKKYGGQQILTIPGNDDPQFSDEYLGSGPFCSLHRRSLALDSAVRIVGVGGSNPTPWKTFREFSEEEIRRFLDETWSLPTDAMQTILMVHVPPWRSGLDNAPKLNVDLSYDLSLGETQRVPVGSTAVRKFLEEHSPAVALFGHIHESSGMTRIGRTLCINPGSSYWQGVLRGCKFSVNSGGVENFQLVEG